MADAVAADGGAGLADELGDLLFQSVFLAQLLEEDGTAPTWPSVARGQADKLIGRHPHVYGEAVAPSRPAGVVDVWERRKREERAGQGDVPRPAGRPARARLRHQDAEARRGRRLRLPRRGAPPSASSTRRRPSCATTRARGSSATCCSRRSARRGRSGADPELALRASAQRFRGGSSGPRALAAAAGEDFDARSRRSCSCAGTRGTRMIARTDRVARPCAAHVAAVRAAPPARALRRRPRPRATS